jgi:polyhydroxyalkanoate synthase
MPDTPKEASRRAADAVGGGTPPVDFDLRGLARAVADLADPRRTLVELPRIASAWMLAALGQQVADFPGRDKRFADRTWQHSPLYRWWGQSYLAWAEALLRVADSPRLDGVRRQRAAYLARVLTAGAAPTNTLAGNPAAIKRALGTGGVSLVRGWANFWRDAAANGGLPAQVDTRAFQVGGNLATTPGAVVYREEMFEILQYLPATPVVRARPLVIVPPQVNKYYFLDLAPGRSFTRYTVEQGVQTFMVVWRNPRRDDPEHGRWDVDAYVAAQLRAIDVVRKITGSPDVNLVGVCAGGLTSALMLGHLAAIGDEPIHAAAFLVTMIDSASSNMITAMAGPRTRHRVALDADRGKVYPKRTLIRSFSWMRPEELVFSYLVSGWLLGDDPPAFDILAWNADATNLAAAFNRDLLEIYASNGAASNVVLGTPVDLHRVGCDTLVVAGRTDHITPWRPCYATAHLFGGRTDVVITSTGHIQTIVNPIGRAGATFWYGPADGADPDAWLASAARGAGSWWPTWSAWLLARSGHDRPAPEALGSPAHPAREHAPGTYVYET